VLCFPVATGEPRGSRETGVDHTANQARDFKIESGIASVGRRDEEDDAGQGTTKNVSSGKKKNFSGRIVSELPPLSKLIALTLVRSHVAAAGVLSIGARIAALIGL
jgi:hypothetical protein